MTEDVQKRSFSEVMRYEDIAIGDSAWDRRTYTQADASKYALVTGDYQSTRNPGVDLPPLMPALQISKILGMELPGPGSAVEMEQRMEFLTPVRPGDVITTKIEVVAKESKTRRIVFRTVCYNQHQEVVLDGSVLMKMLS